MDMAETCRLCLGQNPNSTPMALEDEDFRKKIDKIFYFQVARNRDIPTVVCDACKATVSGFYDYAEQVQKNQEFLRTALVPTSSSSSLEMVASYETLEMGESGGLIKMEYVVKKEPDDAEWMGLDTYCEATIGADRGGEEAKVATEDMVADEKVDQDWTPLGIFGEADDDDDDEDDDDGEDSDDSESDEKPSVGDDEFIEDVKPKRKYKPRKSTPKKAKIEKGEQKPKSKTDGPSIDELVLQHYKLSCDLCSEPLEDFTELRKHYKYVHDEQGYLKCCNKKIFKKCWMVEHIQLHLNPDAFHCDICNKSYSSSKVLKEHTKEVHSPNESRPFKCDTCLKPFVSNAHLNAHIMVAHGSVPCPQCPKLLASQGSLKKHLVAMHGDGEQHVCEVCARVFRSKQCFDTHVKGHLGTRTENRVQCSMCSVWLTDKYCLTKHIRRMHIQPDVALSCELCGKQVRNQDALNCHMRRAHTESRFECEMCHKKFKRPHHMREHIAIHHTGENLYGCNHCPERFNTKNKQYMHRKTVHPVEWEEEMRKRVMKDA
ncbi:transcription factor grauzone-like [Ochlerotatus camptorhynchus]|uniref:transcription factor grauzone-like n=1 Tax=Ochlerotatus camptorhynchus TaxID=644619 RepID=UPI0031D203D5